MFDKIWSIAAVNEKYDFILSNYVRYMCCFDDHQSGSIN